MTHKGSYAIKHIQSKLNINNNNKDDDNNNNDNNDNRKAVDHESDGDTNCSWYAWNNPQRLETGTGRISNQIGLVWFGFMAYQPL